MCRVISAWPPFSIKNTDLHFAHNTFSILSASLINGNPFLRLEQNYICLRTFVSYWNFNKKIKLQKQLLPVWSTRTGKGKRKWTNLTVNKNHR